MIFYFISNNFRKKMKKKTYRITKPEMINDSKRIAKLCFVKVNRLKYEHLWDYNNICGHKLRIAIAVPRMISDVIFCKFIIKTVHLIWPFFFKQYISKVFIRWNWKTSFSITFWNKQQSVLTHVRNEEFYKTEEQNGRQTLLSLDTVKMS